MYVILILRKVETEQVQNTLHASLKALHIKIWNIILEIIGELQCLSQNLLRHYEICFDAEGQYFQQLLQYQISRVIKLKQFFKHWWYLQLDNMEKCDLMQEN
jgi:hypothetical protein